LTSLTEFRILAYTIFFSAHQNFLSTLDNENIGRILVIKLRAIGDVLLSTPVVQNLNAHFPHASIDFLCDKFAEEVLLGNPWISKVQTFDKRVDSSVGVIRKIRAEKYDLVIDLFSNPRSAIIAGLSGAKFRVGFPFRWRKYAFNIIIPPRNGNIHNVEFNLDALRRINVPAEYTHPFFPLSDRAVNFAKEWVHGQGLNDRMIIALNPGGGWSTKRWGFDHYARLGDLLTEHHNAAIILLWGPGEEGDAKLVQSKMKSPSYLIPRTSLSELGAIIQRCFFLVSNDSGPMHIAAALNVHTLGIFGPTNPRQQGPYGEGHRWVRNDGLDCLECSLTSCPIGNICMTQLSVDRVIEAFEDLYTASEKNRTVKDYARKE